MGILAYCALSVVVAVVVHWRVRRYWRACAMAGASTVLFWFAATLPLALADGWRGFGQESPSTVRVAVICFLMAFPIAAVVGLAFRGDHGNRVGLCPECDYDLTGNVSGICPECGTPIEKPQEGSNDT